MDAYIDAAAPFAQPLLRELRRRVHAGAPGLTEAIKWRHPAFLHDGGLVAYMAAFKAHVGFGFWGSTQEASSAAMGQFGRLTSLVELPPPSVIEEGLRDAIARRAAPRAAGTPARAARGEPAMPAAFDAALDANAAARAHFDAFPPGRRREYVEWIAEARREDTRARRVAQAVEWIAQGLGRNWKYERRG